MSQTQQFGSVTELDVKTAPLAQHALIEASAGTGKTYSLKHLVLRLLVEGETPVTIDRLLLVTFTNAATSELSQRIRTEIQALIDRLSSERPGADATLEEQLALWAQAGLTPDAMRTRLQAALDNFDDARIYTIHGFCQRMLKDNVFAGGGDYGYELTDVDDLLQQTVDDFLRRRLQDCHNQDAVETLMGIAGWDEKLRILTQVPKGTRLVYDEDDSDAVRQHIQAFVEWAPPYFETLKRNKRVIGFDDLLKRMNESVLASEDFVRTVRAQFDAVMIDEFQDTDATQYSIFKRLFLENGSIEAPLPKSVFFVGDPKQAIYRFRHAELETYLQAKKDIGSVLSLSRNFRSNGGLICCINGFFDSKNAFLTPDIQYGDIRYDKKKPPLIERMKDGSSRVWPAFELWSDTAQSSFFFENVPDLRDFEDERIAKEIEYLLTHEVYIGSRRVQPSDIAVLVRQRNKAAGLVKQLNKRGIRTLIRSQEDVFKTTQAHDVLAVLRAMESPQRLSYLSAARATPLFGHRLSQFQNDQAALLSARVVLSDMVDTYDRLGVSAAFRYLMRRCETYERLVGTETGDRQLRNYTHILECLHTQSLALKTLSGLTRWFEKQMQSKAKTPEERMVRLESEDNLVTIETIHSSKGLEYPIVYLCHASIKAKASGTKKQTVFKSFDDTGVQLRLCGTQVAENKDAATAAAVEQESARVAYVAMTRASCRLVIPLMNKRSTKTKAPAHDTRHAIYRAILSGSLETKEKDFEAAVARIRARLETEKDTLQGALNALLPGATGNEYRDLFRVMEYDDLEPCAFGDGIEAPMGAAHAASSDFGCDAARAVHESWRQTSFSALVKDSYVAAPVRESDADGGEDETDEDAARDAPVGLRGDILDIAGGKEVGTCLHKLFEEANFARVPSMSDDALRRFVDRVLRRYPTVYGQGEVAENCLAACSKMVRDVLTARLPEPMGWSLSEVATARRVNEMPFLISLGGSSGTPLTAERLAQVLERLDPKYAMGELTDVQLQGYLTGVMDLMCCHNGQFWVIDWKGNRLGTELSAYTPEALDDEMHRHHYRLQYLLYLVALMRFLRDRFGREDVYDLIGGACYVFVRALRPDCPAASAVVFDRPSRAVLTCLDTLLSRGDDAATVEAACLALEEEKTV